MNNNPGDDKVRIDKWLWAARFFKTRSMASQAVAGGKVHVNGERQKASHLIGPGDELRIRRGYYEFVVVVQGVSAKRGPAKVASLLYDETEASTAAREEIREQRRLLNVGSQFPPKRPGKKDRRLIRKFTRKE